jgi:hypothetical protein
MQPNALLIWQNFIICKKWVLQQREANIELEALWNSATRVWDLVLEQVDGPSSLAVSLSSAAELLKGRIDVATANRIRWDTRSVLAATYQSSQS